MNDATLSDVTLSRGWFARRVDVLARDLLGRSVRTTIEGERVVGRIVETEAYLGPEDPASHASTASGITTRNRPMFGPAGYAYIYRSYGIHWCLNLVGGRSGEAGAVLIRALRIVEGAEVVIRRRGRDAHLADGPGRVCQALGVTGALQSHDLTEPPLEILRGHPIPDDAVHRTGRVGVGSAVSWPLRFLVADSPDTSRARVHPGEVTALPEPFRDFPNGPHR
ncbi:MAG: DNA-3-methyladenine glycosylase [Longimicrobiales bacterium]|nr:DNA-3-methyladenine glycosylase [Longimicrobiales bacterium]